MAQQLRRVTESCLSLSPSVRCLPGLSEKIHVPLSPLPLLVHQSRWELGRTSHSLPHAGQPTVCLSPRPSLVFPWAASWFLYFGLNWPAPVNSGWMPLGSTWWGEGKRILAKNHKMWTIIYRLGWILAHLTGVLWELINVCKGLWAPWREAATRGLCVIVKGLWAQTQHQEPGYY